MQVDIDEVVHIKLEGLLAQLLTNVNLELYPKNLSNENRRDVMYGQ
jgi:hypothetical protein